MRKPKKILYIITKSVWGGAQKYVYDLAVNLPKEYRVMVAAGGQGVLAQKLKQSGIEYYEIKNFQRDVSLLKDVLAFFEILKLLFKLRPQIIHTSSSKAGAINGTALFFYSIFNIFQSPFKIFTVHGWAFNEKRSVFQIKLIKFLSKITCLFYNKIICVSEFDRVCAIKNKITKSKKLITIHNGINLNEYRFFTKESARKQLIAGNKLQINEEGLWIGTLGEFTKNKGHKYLIEAAKILIDNLKSAQPSNQSNIYFFFIGQGEEYKNLKFEIRNLKLEKNIFTIENLANAPLHLKAFDIFILPSIKEGLPYTLLEAGLARLPVVASEVGGIPEIIENLSAGSGQANGLLVPPAKPKKMAEAIEKLMENGNLRSELSFELWGKINRKFRLEQMLNATLSTYDNKTKTGK